MNGKKSKASRYKANDLIDGALSKLPIGYLKAPSGMVVHPRKALIKKIKKGEINGL